MAAAPMDMLRRCREQIKKYTEWTKSVVRETEAPDYIRVEAELHRSDSERLVAEIDVTLREWG